MQQSYEEIKKNHPDEWLILGDPIIADNGIDIIAADLLYHSPDKQELAYMDKPLMKKYRFKEFRFNRVNNPPQQHAMISIRSIGQMRNNPDAEPIKSKYAYSDEA